MKKIFLPLLLMLFISKILPAQKIQYSRETFRPPFADAIQTVANVEGFHHLLFFTVGKKPQLYVFNPQLQLHAKQEIDLKLKENFDVQVLRFSNFYLLYLHVPGTGSHRFFRIHAEGEVEDASAFFSNPVDTAWNRSTASFQLFNAGNRLCLLSHRYYDGLREVGSQIVSFSADFQSNTTTNTFFKFDKNTDGLQQIMFWGKDLYVLKTSRDDEKGQQLHVMKVDTASGEGLVTSFASGSNAYVSPEMIYSEADSSVLVYALLRESSGAGRGQRTVFISQLNHQLQENVPVTLLRSQFRGNAAASFLLSNTQQPFWITMVTAPRIRQVYGRTATSIFSNDSRSPNINVGRGYFSESTIDYNQPSAVRFTLLNKNFKPLKDSLVANGGSFYDIQPRPFAKFQVKGKAYLVLIENFSTKKRGLFMASNGANNELAMVSLPVYDRYEYLLPQLQPVANGFVVPYRDKSDMGLLKITFTD